MNETEQMARFLELATNKRIANANQGKVVNKNRLYIFIGTAVFLLLILYLLMFSDRSVSIKTVCAIGVTISVSYLYLLLRKEKSIVPNYFTNQFGKKMSLYNYKLEMMYLYLLLEGYLSPNHSNLAFYDSVLNKIAEVKEGVNISSSIHVPFALSSLIFTLFTFTLRGDGLLVIWIRALSMALIISIFFFCIYFFVCFLIQRSAKPYILLHSIISDLRIKDSIKFKEGSHCSNELHLHISIDRGDRKSK